MAKMSATTPSDATNRHYHIGCKPGDLAEYIVLVGDPSRADRVAKHFDKIRFQTQHREFVSVTGKYKGIDVSVVATGIGPDNTEIAVIEICQITKNPTFIRCGSTGALKKEPKLADLIVSRAALRMDNTSTFFVPEIYPAVADSDVLIAISQASKKLKIPFHVGITASAPGFYGAQGRDLPGFPIRYPNLPDDLARMNVMNFEMEAGTLFTLSALRGIRAGAVCATFSNRPRDEFADEKKRMLGEKRCIDVSLKAFELLRKMDAEKKKRKLPLWFPA